MSLWPTATASATRPDEAKSPWQILNALADQLAPDSQGKFSGHVTETVREEEVTYALYIVVPELRDYMYRLCEVRLNAYLDPYPVVVRFFAKDPKNHQRFSCDTPQELEEGLTKWIQSPLTELLLSALTQQIEIMKRNR
jgi:hypothetical protein